MARPQLTPAQVIEFQMSELERVVRNLLIDNRNFDNGHYASVHPGSGGFIRGPLKSMAEHILVRVDDTRRLAMDMAAEREIPGLARIHTGVFHGQTVTACEAGGGRWKVTIEVNGAWHGGDDRVGEYDGEAAALEAVQSFATTGHAPAGMRPVGNDVPEQAGPG